MTPEPRDAGGYLPLRRAAGGSFLLLTALTAVVAGVVLRSHGTRLETELAATARSTEQAVLSWASSHRAAARVWAASPEVQEATRQLARASRAGVPLVGAESQLAIRARLVPVLEAAGYRGYFIIDPELVNLASSRDTNVGVPSLLADDPTFFPTLGSGSSTLSPPIRTDVPIRDAHGELSADVATMFVGAPIRSPEGELLGYFTFRLDPTEDFHAILGRGGAQEGIERLAFDATGRRLSPRDVGGGLQPGSEAWGESAQDLIRALLATEGSPGRSIREELLATGVVTGSRLTTPGGDGAVAAAALWSPALQMGFLAQIPRSRSDGAIHGALAGLVLLWAAAGVLTWAIMRSGERQIRLEVELEGALTRALADFVPLCSNCKSVKQDDGGWEKLEVHLREQVNTKVSHGICPECAKELYGDLLDEELMD